jgi:hypothetical protein
VVALISLALKCQLPAKYPSVPAAPAGYKITPLPPTPIFNPPPTNEGRVSSIVNYSPA